MSISNKFGCILLLLTAACSTQAGADDVTQTAARLTVPDTGFIPYPITSPSGSREPSWDGSVVDLMAADAFAQCARGTTAVGKEGLYADEYLAYLRSKMTTAMCAPAHSGPGSTVENWSLQRVSLSECNIDLTTRTPATIRDITRDRTAYIVPPLASLGLKVAPDVLPKNVQEHAQTAVDIADVNLCLAQRLRESMNTADVLVASAEDQMQLLNTIRERAQVAMVQYALLGLVFASTESLQTTISHPLQYLPVLRAWAASPSVDATPAMSQLGADFAAAIELHADITEELGRALLRTRGGEASTWAGRNWGDNSGRARLLRLLYGGDPQADWGNSTLTLADGRDAEIEVLLGLARQADALYLRISGSPYAEKAPLDETSTVDRIYRTVEAWIRTHDCQLQRPGDTTCVVAYNDPSIPTVANYQDSFLWKRHHVAPRHAAALAHMVRDAMPGVYHEPGRWHFMGQHSSELQYPYPGAVEGWIHVDPKYALAPVVFGARAAQFLDNRLNLPRSVTLYLNPREQGFVADWAGSGTRSATGGWAGDSVQAMRQAGAVTALAAIRSAVYQGSASLDPGPQAFYRPVAGALKLVEAAIGRTSFGVRQKLTATTAHGAGDCQTWADPTPPAQCGILEVSSADGTTFSREMEVITEADDPYVGLVVGDYRGPEQVAAALAATYRSFDNRTQQDMVAGFLGMANPVERAPVGDGLERRIYRFTGAAANQAIYFYRPITGGKAYSPALVWTGRVFTYLNPNYRQAADSQFLGLGGALNQLSLHAWAIHPRNWSLPRYDNLGVPVDWVPPVDPTLIGGQANSSPIPYYLGTARTAAEEATLAISTAIDGLLAETNDVTALEASRQRANQVNLLEKQALLGNADAAPTSSTVTLPIFACEGLSTNQAAKCNEVMGWAAQAIRPLMLATPVSQALNGLFPYTPGKPLPVDNYAAPWSGGKMYTLITQQANAVNAVYGLLFGLYEAAIAAAENIAAADVALASAQAAEARMCSSWQFETAALTSFSYSKDSNFGPVGVDENGIWMGDDEVDNVSFSPAVLLSAYNTCWATKDALGPAEQNAATVVSNVYMQLGIQLGQLTNAMSTLAQASADFRQALHDADIVTARNELDLTLSTYSVTTRFGATRRFHHYDLWRAKALLENARRLAATARRAIESRFVVDLSRLDAPEPFVAAPSTWADDIYAPDLDPPAAVGLNLQSATAGSTITSRSGLVYAQKVLDYVGNLDLFVQGYSVARPTTAAFSESEIVSLVGPDQVEDTTCVTPTSVCTTPSSCLHIERIVLNSDTTTDQHIRPYMRVVNSGTASVALSDLTIRYWFSVDSTAAPELQLWCDYATVSCDQLVRSISTVTPAATGADRYIEVKFDGSAVLAPGAYTEVQIRVNRADWVPFNESNDFSYAASPSYTAASKIALYKSGFLVWGSEPSGGSSPGCALGQAATRLPAQAGLWDFYCPTTNVWIKHPSLGRIPVTDRLNTACSGTHPAKARITFSLDPWGRLFGEIPDDPYFARHNVRWKRLAVNLVGTGIRDCANAADPLTCYTESFIRYNLEHGGRAWVTDYDQRWRTLGLPTALIEGAKALATEEWLDPVAHGWALPMVSSVARWELASRPLGGDYTLTFEVTPDLRLDRIERIQILTESDYWLRQN